jgi:hypothetical protein
VCFHLFASKIFCVTLHQTIGKLKKDFDTFRKVLLLEYESVFGPVAPSLSVSKGGTAHSHEIGILESMYYVQVCSREDSQNHLVQTAQDICHAVSTGALQHSQINVTMVEQKWKDMHRSLQDPDLLVVFGGVSTTGGFPVWQMRFSEVHTHPTHKKLSYKEFVASLEAFARCKQNFGK